MCYGTIWWKALIKDFRTKGLKANKNKKHTLMLYLASSVKVNLLEPLFNRVERVHRHCVDHCYFLVVVFVDYDDVKVL